MKTKPKTIKLLLYILLALTLILVFLKPSQSVAPQNIQVLFPSGSSLAFQNDINSNVTLLIITGILNSSENKLGLNSGGGFFRFTALNDTQIKITYSNCAVKVGGDQGNELRIINSGSTITASTGDSVLIVWDRQIEPWLPMMFIFGMVGLGAMIGGPLYAINKIKKREYLEALRTGTIVTVIGIALFIAWLW